MYFKQYYLACLAHASYLIGDAESGSAVVVDPQRDIDAYLEDARREGLSIDHVFLTHFHADFVAGHLDLRERCGARIHLGARASAEFPFAPAKDGDRLDLGKLRISVLETPGHTPEGISLLVFDLERDALKPHAVLTGDTLFIGDVGRPDLMASIGVTAEELAGWLYDSLHQKLLKLPDETLVYPAHGAGSMCGKNLSKERVSTIGEQRRLNYALKPMPKADFIRIVAADQPEAPPYFAYDASFNGKDHVLLADSLKRIKRPLALDEVLRARSAGAQILDARDPAAFEAGHLAGSINVGLGGTYATWAGTVLDRERPIVVVVEPGREEEALLRLGRIGFDQVSGYLAGGIEAASAEPELLRRVGRLSPKALAERLGGPKPPLVLDVRTPEEVAGGRIDGSLNIPLNKLRGRAREVPNDRDVVVTCRSGYRSAIAVGLLEAHGLDRLSDLEGGMQAWEQSATNA